MCSEVGGDGEVGDPQAGDATGLGRHSRHAGWRPTTPIWRRRSISSGPISGRWRSFRWNCCANSHWTWIDPDVPATPATLVRDRGYGLLRVGPQKMGDALRGGGMTREEIPRILILMVVRGQARQDVSKRRFRYTMRRQKLRSIVVSLGLEFA